MYKSIYLDYAAATPLEPSLGSLMQKIYKKNFSSPSSIHDMGEDSKKVLERARNDVARILGAHSNELVFTSGSTESNNLAIIGVINATTAYAKASASRRQEKSPHIVTTNIEHSSVLEICRYLEATKKASVTYVDVEGNGIVDPKKIKKALRKNTVLVSLMYANSEIGTIEPIRDIAKEIRHFNKLNSRKILFHTDATQAVNYLPIQVEKLGVDMMSLSSVKFYGPKGVGLLYVKKNTPVEKIMWGGDQQFGLRPGSYNLPGVVGFAKALEVTEKIKEKEVVRLTKLRDYFFEQLKSILGRPEENSSFLGSLSGATAPALPLGSPACETPHKREFSSGLIINGDLKNRLPNNVNITIPNIPSDLLVIELSARGIIASGKSACKEGDGKASHVIKAINKNFKDTDGSLRFSLGRYTTKADIDYTIKALSQILLKLKKWYN